MPLETRIIGARNGAATTLNPTESAIVALTEATANALHGCARKRADYELISACCTAIDELRRLQTLAGARA